MWKTRQLSILILSFLLLMACASESLQFIDSTAWKKDIQGCTGYRSSLEVDLNKYKNQLQGKDDVYIFRQLGKPNRVSFGERGKKVFSYFIKQDSACSGNQPVALVLEFNATGFVQLAYLSSTIIK
ncbi:MAG: hypothetical protein MUE33_05360 [Cytophagaceae bacterium]|nr:hypothetical protein [Cytophagaceae bacterium]